MPSARSAIESNMSLDKVDVHDHAVLFYEEEAQKKHLLSRLVKLACDRNEACIFVMRRDDDGVVKAIMAEAGLRPDCLSREGRVAIVDPREELDGTTTTAAIMLDIMSEIIDSVIDMGFTAVRIINDMEFLGSLLPDYELVIFESLSNELFEERKAIGLCMVHSAGSRSNVMNAIMTHPTLILKGYVCNNHFYMPPDQCSRLFGSPPGMPFILDKFLEIQMSELATSASDEELRLLNTRLQSEMERRQMVEWALLRSENDYRAAMNAIEEMILVTDRANKVLLANDAFLDVLDKLGYNGPVIGEDIASMMPQLDCETVCRYKDIFSNGRPSHRKGRLAVDGRDVFLEVKKIPIMDGGEVGRVLTVVRELSLAGFDRSGSEALRPERAPIAMKGIKAAFVNR